MSSLKCINYKGYEEVSNAFGISSAVRIPPNATIIALSGMTADFGVKYANLEEQIFAAYENVNKALAAACPEKSSEEIWKCVYNVTSYHVEGISAEVGDILHRAGKKYMGDHRPAHTAVGVESLVTPECLIEIQVQAAVHL